MPSEPTTEWPSKVTDRTLDADLTAAIALADELAGLLNAVIKTDQRAIAYVALVVEAERLLAKWEASRG